MMGWMQSPSASRRVCLSPALTSQTRIPSDSWSREEHELLDVKVFCICVCLYRTAVPHLCKAWDRAGWLHVSKLTTAVTSPWKHLKIETRFYAIKLHDSCDDTYIIGNNSLWSVKAKIKAASCEATDWPETEQSERGNDERRPPPAPPPYCSDSWCTAAVTCKQTRHTAVRN